MPIYNSNLHKGGKELKKMLDIVPPSFKTHDEIEPNLIPQQEPVIYEVKLGDKTKRFMLNNN